MNTPYLVSINSCRDCPYNNVWDVLTYSGMKNAPKHACTHPATPDISKDLVLASDNNETPPPKECPLHERGLMMGIYNLDNTE